MSENMKYYDKLKAVPQKYTKPIKAGRLKGMTDIKPQWRTQVMTEVFGSVGMGWYTKDVEFEYMNLGDEVVCNCRLNLYVKVDGEWSAPIFGTGGSKLSTKESRGVYVSDEAEKMAYTDALSVAMKALGVGADIYMGHGATKYSEVPQTVTKKKMTPEIKSQMKDYIAKNGEEGKGQIKESLLKYEVSEADRKEILG